MRVALCTLVATAALAAPGAVSAEPPVSRLDQMISPVSVPTVNEDPRITTELRPMYLYTTIPGSFVTGGGHYSVVAVQARVAITDRIGFIATKDGYIYLRPDNEIPGVVENKDGFANIAFGFKGSVWQDEASASIVTLGMRYEAPTGNTRVLQGQYLREGDGVLNPFLSASKGFDDFHMQLYTGPRVGISDGDTSFWDLSVHFDYRLFERLYPLLEFNWIHSLDGGRRLPIAQEGFDLVNLGASESSGNSVATIAFGTRVRLFDGLDFGITGEYPMTSREDIIGWRITTDLIWRPAGWDFALFR
jgi:hypothetical protein